MYDTRSTLLLPPVATFVFAMAASNKPWCCYVNVYMYIPKYRYTLHVRVLDSQVHCSVCACLKLTPGVNQQIMAINNGPGLDAGVPRPNAKYSLEVVRVEDDDKEQKVLRRLV